MCKPYTRSADEEGFGEGLIWKWHIQVHFEPISFWCWICLLKVPLEIVIWIYDTFDNTLRIKYGFIQFVMESCGNILMDISSNIFLAMLLPFRFHCRNSWVKNVPSKVFSFSFSPLREAFIMTLTYWVILGFIGKIAVLGKTIIIVQSRYASWRSRIGWYWNWLET